VKKLVTVASVLVLSGSLASRITEAYATRSF